VSRDFLLQVSSVNHLPPSPRKEHYGHFEFFRKFVEIFASEGALPVSMTPAANFATGTAGVVDTRGKFSNAVNDTGCK
jgi:hypothetical protein